MQKSTRVLLWVAFVAVAVCVPTIIAREIIETGNWWVMLFGGWALGIELVIWKLVHIKGM